VDPKPKRDLSAWFHEVSKNNSIDLIPILIKNTLSLDFGTLLLSTSTNY
jgi:hypothetical protein